MAVYFRLSPDGRSALVAKTLIEKKISEKEFDEKAKLVRVEELIKNLPAQKAAKVEATVRRLGQLTDMKVTCFGTRRSSNPSTRTSSTSYWLGGRVFIHEYGEYAERFERAEAIQYGKDFYGAEFMEEHNIEKMESFKFEYFKGDRHFGVEQITQEEYEAVKEEIKALTSIVSLNKSLKQDAGKR